MRDAVNLALAIAGYIVSSIAAVATIKQLNYNFCFCLPWFLGLTCRSSFIWAFLIHVALQSHYNVKLGRTGRQLLICCGVGTVNSLAEAASMLSMSILPGSWYSLIKGSELVFNLLLSRLVLRKAVPVKQYIAVVLISTGVAINILSKPPVTKQHALATSIAKQNAGISTTSAAWLAVTGACLTALTTVATEGYLKSAMRDEQQRHLQSTNGQDTVAVPSLLYSNAFALDTTAIAFLYLLVPYFWSGETHQLPQAMTTGCNDVPFSSALQIALLLFLLMASLVRQSEKLCKYYICFKASSLFFSVVQSVRKLLNVFVLAVLFGEELSPTLCVSVAFSIAGLAFYLRGSVEKGRPAAKLGSTQEVQDCYQSLPDGRAANDSTRPA